MVSDDFLFFMPHSSGKFNSIIAENIHNQDIRKSYRVSEPNMETSVFMETTNIGDNFSISILSGEGSGVMNCTQIPDQIWKLSDDVIGALLGK